MKSFKQTKVNIEKVADILKYKNIYNYDFIIDLKLLLIVKNEHNILKKIITKFPDITINGLTGKQLYININYLLFKLKKEYLYKEYKIIIKGIGCNAKCPMCMDWKRKGDIDSQLSQLREIVRIIINEDVGIKRVDILGGEPLIIFDELLDLVKVFYENNIYVSFTTNASLLDYEKIDKLILSGLETFTFSLDFPNEKHDIWRSLEGAFEKIVKFTNYIHEKGKIVIWSSVVGKFNYKYLEDFQKLYNITKPDFHNFVKIEKNYVESNEGLFLNQEQEDSLKEIFKKLEKNTNLLIHGFNKNNEKNCLTPLYKKTFIIKENKINVSPCDSHPDVKDFYSFTLDAITGKCKGACDSSYTKNHLKILL